MSNLLNELSWAETFLLDRCPGGALICIRRAILIASGDELPEAEDIGDVYTHLLRSNEVRRAV